MRLLRNMGYRSVRDYHPGLAGWREAGGRVVGQATPTRRRPAPADGEGRANATTSAGRVRPRSSRIDRFVDMTVTRRSIGQLLAIWWWVSVLFGVVYWGAEMAGLDWLRGVDADDGLRGLPTSIYFSFVSALSIGYGDLAPLGPARVLAVFEGAAGLLIFGCVISKLVSRRQEQLLEETHRITFEDRLGRVRTNLHLVLGELHELADLCGSTRDERARSALMSRIESAAAVFDGEAQAIHDLLYRPEQTPDEQVLESILASLAACLRQLSELLDCLPSGAAPSRILTSNLNHLRGVAVEICSDCVPYDYAVALREWMDRIRELAETLPDRR